MSDIPPDGQGGGLGGQPGEQGPGELAPLPPGDIIQPIHDDDDTQPQRGPSDHNNRRYIAADWAAPGTGGGHPKLSGGVEVDIRTGDIAPRGLNRKNQRYELTQTEIQIRRKAQAILEYAGTSICLGESNQYEVRTASGNSYDVSANLVTCDCPDWFKQEQSGYGIVRCKHIWMCIKALSDPALPDGLDWGTSKWAQAVGVSEREAQMLCNDGTITAFKVNSNWHIPAVEAEASAAVYRGKMWPFS